MRSHAAPSLATRRSVPAENRMRSRKQQTQKKHRSRRLNCDYQRRAPIGTKYSLGSAFNAIRALTARTCREHTEKHTLELAHPAP